MNKNVIHMDNVSFYYKENPQPSLDCVNLQVQEGEILVLCGESGCGKSTIIRMINGLIPFYYTGRMEGNTQVCGHNTGKGSIYDLGSKVSTVFQNPRSQFFCVDVRSELAFGAENLKFDKEEILRRIEKTSRELNCGHLLDRTMFELSGGEKQKIACASVSITDNPIVVLDEPSSNLDIYAIEELKNMILYWKKKGKTVVIAEHRLQYLQELADRFVYMKKGRIIREFTSRQITELSPEELMEMGLRALSYEHLKIMNREKASSFFKINNFAFKYKGSEKLNLSIEKAELPKASVTAVIGRNGAGKSTFVRCLSGLEKKSRGVLLDGEKTMKSRQRLNQSFLVMQDVNRQLFTESVEEELSISMEKEDQKLLDKLLEEFDLTGYRNQHPMSLSGGQKQRTAVASAMASLRNFIIFDEPTSGLDYYHMCQVADCIKKLQEKGKTIFLITHDIELIYCCCNYILHLEDGRIKELYHLDSEHETKLKTFFQVESKTGK